MLEELSALRQERAKWVQLRRDAEQGNVEAQIKLGDAYSTRYSAADQARATKWYRKAAEQGNAEAQYTLGSRLVNAQGTWQRANYVEGAAWYRKAAEQGHTKAQRSLGDIYAHGLHAADVQGVDKNEAEAEKWYYKADEEYRKVAEEYRKAAEQGNAVAQYNLAGMYAAGRGVAKNEKEAVNWYRKAAKQGHMAAQFELGHCYLWGYGVTKDEVEALAWYYVANADVRTIGPVERNIGARSRLAAQQRAKEISASITTGKQ
jgi:TPR repeat protein